MIKITNFSIQRGANVLIEKADVLITAKSKVGIIGKNGTGKSSFFACFRGELEPAKGDIHVPNQLRVAHLAQEIPALDISALTYVMQGDHAVAKTLQAIADAEASGDMDALMDLYTYLNDIDGYTVEARAGKILHGLGFTDDDFQKKVSEFSGGWRMRLNLAQCLLTPADLLLLDEPTNHLDLEAIVWLEKWIIQFPGTVLIISHDREFLDHVTDHILHFEQKTIKAYTGNYTQFEDMRLQAMILNNAQYEKQQAQLKHLMHFVERFRAKASKARQAQSRLKAVERMELLAPIHLDSPFKFEFLPPEKIVNPMFVVENVDVGYDPQAPLIKKIKFKLSGDARIGLLGKNGCGKSTFLACLMNQIEPLQGQLNPMNGVKIGYFAQHQVDHLDLNLSPVELLQDAAPKTSTQSIRDFLGGFAFNNDRVFEKITYFSGGEKARLALALIVWQRPNLLILDEPTNHLDLDMREALNLALQSFQGALIVVSHDRYLLRNTVNELWLVHDKKMQEFSGDIDDYAKWVGNNT
ncbi:MAG: ATP-binding cassette domain-containing protein [Legionellales bacterium]|nr:ATP-binding cassette domain-containing protein [Legionellales bacterium]